jgi:hypothetical protein
MDLPTLAIKAAVQEPRIATSLVGFRKPQEVRSLAAGSGRLDAAPRECQQRPCVSPGVTLCSVTSCGGLCAAVSSV